MHPLFAGVITFFALFAGAYHYYARPHMATLLLMPVFMAAIVDFERGRGSRWRLFWLIPLGIIWTNLHGGVLGGVFTLGLAVAGWGLLFLFNQASPIRTWRSAWFMLAVLVACLLTPFVNPFGMEMLHTWKRIVGSTAMKEYVSEHQPLSLSNTAGQVTAAFGLFYVFALAGTFHRRPKVSWLLPLVWLALSIQGIRQGPLFAVIALVALADFWHETIWHSLLKKYGDSLAREVEEARTFRGAWIPAYLVLLAFTLQVAKLPVPLLGSGWAKLDARHNPMELKDPLENYAQHAPAGTRIFNDANLGGYVLYHAPQLKIFMDDRFELYGDDWMRDYVEVIYSHPERIEDWADTYGFDHAVILIESERLPLEKYLAESPRWETIARGNRGALFRRLPTKHEFSLITK